MLVHKAPRARRNQDCDLGSKGPQRFPGPKHPARRLTHGAGLFAIATLAMMLAANSPASAWQAPLVNQTPPQVLNGTAKLLAPYDPAQMLRLVFALKPPHMQAEEQFLHDLQTKGSPQFHQFLTADEWNARFAPSVQDEQAVVDWVQGQGLTLTHRYPNRLLVDVQAPAGAIEKALGVTLNSYQLGPTKFFSNDRDPVIPANLTSIVLSVEGLNNLARMHPASKGRIEPASPDYAPGPVVALGPSMQASGDRTKLPQNKTASHLGAGAANITNGAYDPTDIYSSEAYDFNALYNQGHCCNPLGNAGNSPPETSIAIATFGDQDPNDIAGFHNQYPYLAYDVQRVYIDGTPSCCDQEGTMDVQWSTAMSNSFGSYIDTSKVWVYEAATFSNSAFLDMYNQMLSDGNARVFSTSWSCTEFANYGSSDCYSGTMDARHNIFNQMTGQGWTLVTASGDRGSTDDCATVSVSYPATDPNFVAAGGTTLSLFSDGTFSNETGWSGGPDGCRSNDGGGGGGVSSYYAVPSYQSPLGNLNRETPDIALNADWYNTPQNMYFQGSLSGNGGTSIVAPELAGFFAQENAYLLILGNICGSGSSPCAPMGNANYYLYQEGIYAPYASHYPFYDTTSGCNSNDITTALGLSYYCAGSGYDMVTGWGSANMLQLAWAVNTYLAFDGGAPAVTFTGPPANQWYNSDQTVSWTVADTTGGSYPANGVAGFSQAWDADPGDVYSEPTPGSGNSFYSGPQFPNATSGSLDLAGAGTQGCHTVNVRAWDNAGLSSGAITYGPLCYDTVAPATSAIPTPYPNGAGWNNASVQVALSASDSGSGSGTGSGVAATYYSLDNASCSPGSLAYCALYSSPFNVTSQAKHAVYYFSKDKAGNFGSVQALGVNIDETAPHTTASLSGTTSVLVTLVATDTLSGVASMVYQLDGGAITTYTAPFTVSSSGSHTVTFHSTDNAGNVEATETATFTISSNTTTTLTSSLNPSTYGGATTFTATVTSSSGTPTGTVSFKDGSTTIGMGTLSSGKTSLAISTLAAGSHSITAVYAGDSTHHGSTSSALTQTVNKENSMTSVTSSLNPSTYGTSVTFTATVTSSFGTPTGSVTFKDGSSTLGAGTLSSGKATFAISTLAASAHSITAVYGGDANRNSSTSSTLTETVNKAGSKATLTSSVNPSSYDQTVTFTAKASSTTSGTPTGTVTFKNGSVVLGTSTLNAGTATLSVSSLTVGTQSLTAVYPGDSNFNGSTSAALSQSVNKAKTTLIITSSLNPSISGQSVTFTATVTGAFGGSPSGTVTFKNGSVVLGTGTLNSSTHQAKYTTSTLANGSHSIFAIYGGDSNFITSTSPSITQNVNP